MSSMSTRVRRLISLRVEETQTVLKTVGMVCVQYCCIPVEGFRYSTSAEINTHTFEEQNTDSILYSTPLSVWVFISGVTYKQAEAEL